MSSKQDSSSDSNLPARRRRSRSSKFAILLVVIYAILGGGLCYGGMIRHILYSGLISAGFLAVYAAGPLAIVLWVAFMIRRVAAKQKTGSILRFALKSGVIIFGTIGLALWTPATIRPNATTVSAGYWIHAKLRIDIREIRTWAVSRRKPLIRFEPIDRDEWPESLRRVSIWGGTVTCDPKTRTVIFHEGGDYVRWGLTVGDAQAAPPGDRSEIELESGAWVWCE
jgi:hypothetical protein